jgi:hypothetical protein
MTPFDGAALLAILGAFYPVVSIATLVQARADRPSAFSNGALVGDGDRLQLADGRVFLLMYQGAWVVVGATDNAAAAGVWDGDRIAAFFLGYGLVVAPSVIAQWQDYWTAWGWKDPSYFLFRLQHAQELVDAGLATLLPADTGGDGLALEAGPLVPIDEAISFAAKRDPQAFESLVGDSLGGLDGTGAALDQAQAHVEAFDPAGATAALDNGTLEDVGASHDGTVAALAGETIDDIGGATDGQSASIDPTRGSYDEEPPPDAFVPDPGDPPDKTNPNEPGGPPAA